ncbi:ABC transporter permease [Nocardioides insulae]|uniref:ABC transporter permease n=1 Tax=Nocardioides insulae TaxID=394734 RepID=UPI0003FF3191|nr:ABC transporter permease [Nocardioides insulae]
MTAAAITEEGTVDIRDRADVVRQIRQLVVFAIVAVLTLVFWLSTEDAVIPYRLGEGEDVSTFDGAVALVLCFLLALVALGLAAVNRVPRGWAGTLIYLAVGLAFVLSFLIWSYGDQMTETPTALLNPLPGTVRLSTPLILGAMAGCLCERAGVINLAIEGQMLVGAYFAALAATVVSSATFGLVGGLVAGVALSVLLGFFALRYQMNQVVLGVVLIALATGLTDFLLSQLPRELNEPEILQRIAIPVLSDIPLLGPTLFDQNLLVYLMYVAVAGSTLLLFETRWGLRVRAVGEHPKAADTVGIKVNRLRWQAVLLGGAMAGLGGAYFTVGSTGSFDSNASAGNGFIALAAVIMGRWHPIGATLSACLFGFCFTLQAQLAFLDKIPGELLRASPYLVTLIAVAGFVGRVRPPAADGEPYVKG